MHLKDIQLDWLNWALLGGLSFGLLSIFVRYANDGGVRGEVSLIVVLLVAGMGFFIAALRDHEARSSLLIQSRHVMLFLALIAFAVVGNGALFVAYAETPNLAYAIAIDNSRIIILYLIGLVLFHEQWNLAKTVGIVLTFIGIILLG